MVTLDELDRRLRDIENLVAVDTERYLNITKRLDTIDSHINKVVWLIMSVVIISTLSVALKVAT